MSTSPGISTFSVPEPEGRAGCLQPAAAGTKSEENIQHRTSNAEHRTGRNVTSRSKLDVGCWTLDVLPCPQPAAPRREELLPVEFIATDDDCWSVTPRFGAGRQLCVPHERFRLPMHAKKRMVALHGPDRPSNRSLPWESGAKDARTPNADAWSADSAASAKRLECIRFIGAFPPALDVQWFMSQCTVARPRRLSMSLVLTNPPLPPPRRGSSMLDVRCSMFNVRVRVRVRV